MKHILHQQCGRNSRTADGKDIGIKNPVMKVFLLGGNLLGLGVVGFRPSEGSRAIKYRFDVG